MSKRAFGSKAAETKGPAYSPSREFSVAEDIIPVAQLKAQLGDVIRSLPDRRPLIVTLNGKPAAVLLAPREFDRLTYRARVVASIDAGVSDADAGRVIDDAELGRRIARRYRVKAAK